MSSNPTSGLGVATAVTLTGTGVVQLVPRVSGTRGVSQFAVSVPIGGSVAITALPIDNAGNAVTPPTVTISVPTNGNLGTASNYAVLGASAVTGSTGAGSVVEGGDLGSSPTATINNFPPSSVVLPGVIHATSDAATIAAQVDLAAAIVYWNSTYISPGGSHVVAGDDMSTNNGGGGAGVYYAGKFTGGALDIPTDITLDAQGDSSAVFVFVSASTTTLESGASVILANGALPQNVYWVVLSSFTSVWNGIVSNMVGNILAHTSITLGGGDLQGRALANTGAVTMATTEDIDAPTFTPNTETLPGTPYACNAFVNAGAPLSVPAWYRPSAFVSGTAYPSTYQTPATLDDDDANPWTVRGRSAGQVIIDFQCPTFENTEGQGLNNDTPHTDLNAVMDETYIDTIFAQLIVTVTGGTS